MELYNDGLICPHCGKDIDDLNIRQATEHVAECAEEEE